MSKQSVSLIVDQEKAEQIKQYYLPYQKDCKGDYIVFQATYHHINITIYLNKKQRYKVNFIGEDVLVEARKWQKDIELENKNILLKEDQEWLCLDNQIGSDEVGVGDFLLPMVVVSAFVRKKDIPILKKFGVKDSKKISDDKILEIVPPLLKIFHVSKLTIANETYNKVIKEGENLNSIKAKMHNRALLNLYKKFPDTKNIFVDQFVNENKYFSYLNDPKENKIINIVFKTKGETYYPCVALASLVARYAFLLEKEKLENKYKMKFPFGANKSVDQFSIKFIKKFGIKEFSKICKQNFANFKNLTKNEQD